MRKKTTSNTGLASLLLGGGKKAGAVLRKHICVKNPPPTQNPKTLPAKLKKTDQYAKI